MLLSDDRQMYRDIYFQTWEKHNNNLPLEPIEQQIITIILEHPEYQSFLEDREKYYDKDFSPQASEVNPFLHFALHIAAQDQVALNRPKGVAKLYREMVKLWGEHDAQHCFMHNITHEIWVIQREGRIFDEKAYIHRLKKNIRSGRWYQEF